MLHDAFTLGLLRSDVDAFGRLDKSVFDYLAAGLPGLNNYPGWVADSIVEHDAEIAVPPDDREAFADALGVFAGETRIGAETWTAAHAGSRNRRPIEACRPSVS